MKEIKLAQCTVRVGADFVVTIFPDGRELLARANRDAESLARAEALGYGGDTWRMSLEHELTHSLLAQALGLPASPTLHAAAGGPDPGSAVRAAEEAVVLALQALATCGRDDSWAAVLRLFGHDPDDLVAQLKMLREALQCPENSGVLSQD